MTNDNNKMIDPADVQALLDEYDDGIQTSGDRDFLIHAIRNLLPKPDYPSNMLGRWAVHPDYGRVLVCSAKPDKDGEVEIAFHNDIGYAGVEKPWVDTSTLTFPEPHPETLTTLEDYKNAPVGTIASEPGRYPVNKMPGGEWRNYTGFLCEPNTTRHMLRWGWGECA